MLDLQVTQRVFLGAGDAQIVRAEGRIRPRRPDGDGAKPDGGFHPKVVIIDSLARGGLDEL